jgi:anhydro-N-acetylmuramic acid kinase
MCCETEKEFMSDKYRCIGLMSGTSLDGLDIAFCIFEKKQDVWSYAIEEARTIPYSKEWIRTLRFCEDADSRYLMQVHMEYGNHCGLMINEWFRETGLQPDFIASHGHTVFHRPEAGYTFQLGHGAAIASATNIDTICDFRAQDVALHGHGAPLVPIGDKLLFGDFDACLNIGGFANISYDSGGIRKAFDICPVNTVLNHLAERLGKEFDENGMLAAAGTLIPELFERLEEIPYYCALPPKSLGREWLGEVFFPVLRAFEQCDIKDLMHTVSEHFACRIAAAIATSVPGKRILATGGGVCNRHLISRLRSKSDREIIIPADDLVKFKEALIFAFLGVLRLRGENNCLASVTGALRDHCSGVVYLGHR